LRRATDASGLLLANCTDAQLRITANLQLQYLLVYNMSSTSISPLLVDTNATLTLLNAVFLGSSVTGVPQSNASLHASAIYLHGSARLEASGLVVQGNAQRFTPPATAHSQQDTPSLTASAIVARIGCPATVAHSVFSGNGVRRDGGAATDSGTALLRNSLGIRNSPSCNITLYNNTFINNWAQNWAGAVWLWGSQAMHVDITQNVFALNRVASSSSTRDCDDGPNAGRARGGAMAVMSRAGNVSLSRNRWAENHACMLGGALSVFDVQDVVIQDDVFERNSADTGMGGALVLQARESSRAELINVSFTGNAAQRGGALFVEGMDLDCKDTMFSGNWAKISGGGLQCELCGDVGIYR
jgi:hypothetical protein